MVSSNESYLIIKANVLALITIFSIVFLLKESESYSRTFVMVFFLLNGLLPVWIYFIKRYMMQFPWLREDIIVVSDRPGFYNIEQWFTKDNAFGYDIKVNVSVAKEEKSIGQIEKALDCYPFHTAVVAIDNDGIEQVFHYMEYLQHRVNRVIVLPKMTKMPLIRCK